MQHIAKTTHTFFCIFLMINESTDLEPQPFKHSTMLQKTLKCLTNFPMIVLSMGTGKLNQFINHQAQSFNSPVMTI